jgi:hypothetical protein
MEGKYIRDLFERAEETADARSGLRAIGDTAPKATAVQKRLLDVAVSIRQDAPDDLLFQHSVLTQTHLPAKRPPEDVLSWHRQQGRAVLLIEAGKAYHTTRQEWVQLGLPFGPKARLILMHLNSEAIRTQSPLISAGSSLTSFVRRIQRHDPTGPEIRAFKEQLSRLASATVRLAITEGERAMQVDTKIIGAFDLWFPRDENQRVLWPGTVRLSLDYFESLSRYAVPLDERAIAALAHSALALDVYCWLAQRLHRIPQGRGQLVPWASLYEQFGQGYAAIRFFRRDMLKTLTLVKAVYQAARFDVDRRGLIVWTSPTPVATRLVVLPPRQIDL